MADYLVFRFFLPEVHVYIIRIMLYGLWGKFAELVTEMLGITIIEGDEHKSNTNL